jgi:hypothetical protein
MDAIPDDTHGGRLSLIRAEQRKVESLKHMNMPWVFVEPTRINFAKASKRKPAAEEPNDDGFSFLRQSKTPFTADDLEILNGSLNPRPPTPPSAIGEPSASAPALSPHSGGSSSRDAETPPPDEESLLSGRDDHLDQLFEARIDEQYTRESLLTRAVPEQEAAKQVIMETLQDRAGRHHTPKLPVRIVSYEEARMGERAVIAPAELSEGRQKLIEAVAHASDLSTEVDSLTVARRKLQNESALKRAALEQCFGARPFRDFLAKKKAPIPEPLASLGPPVAKRV